MSQRKKMSVLLVSALLLFPLHVFADDAVPTADPVALFGGPFVLPDAHADKSDYTLFNPVPDDQLRAFSTDRPGKTHSSTTVDAGHFQIESDFANYTYDQYSKDQQTTKALSVATPILKAGVTPWADVEMGFAFYNQTKILNRSSGTATYGSGFGDVLLGSKINVFGNEGGRQSLALLPFVKFPTASPNVGNGVAEYTLNVPYTVDLDNLWSVTAEPAFGRLKNSDDVNKHGDYSFLVNLNRPVFVKTVTAAIEFASEYEDRGQSTPRYTLDPSLQWLVAPNLQLDLGSYIGLNKAAPDYNLYSGISFRY